jgi:hypothetical protein
MKQILIWKGKHSDAYYDASTDEDLANAALDVIRSWMEWQFIRPGEDPLREEYVNASWNDSWRETVEWSKKDLAEESEATQLYNDKVKKAKAKVARRLSEYQEADETYAEAKRLVDEWDTSVVTPAPRQGQTRMLNPKPYVKAWHFLQSLPSMGSEYQDVRIEQLIEFDEEDD